MLQNVELIRLEESLDQIRAAPSDGGAVELIARRPAVDEREVLTEAWLDDRDGLAGDTWRIRGSSRTADGTANREAQLTLMNARAAAAIAGERERFVPLLRHAHLPHARECQASTEAGVKTQPKP